MNSKAPYQRFVVTFRAEGKRWVFYSPIFERDNQASRMEAQAALARQVSAKGFTNAALLKAKYRTVDAPMPNFECS